MASGQIFTAMLLLSSSPTLLRESSLPRTVQIHTHLLHTTQDMSLAVAVTGMRTSIRQGLCLAGSIIYGSSYTSHTSYTQPNARQCALCAQIPPVPPWPLPRPFG